MKIFYDLHEKNEEAIAVALGNFDGIHLGHRNLLTLMKKEAEKKNIKTAVFTFHNHTNSILLRKELPNMLTDKEQKVNILKDIGIDFLYMINFDKKIMTMEPKEFVEKIIIEKLNAKLVVVGFNYRFGYQAKGDGEYLKKLGKEIGFDVIIVPPVNIGEELISSTYIRKLIKDGNISKANEILGRHYTIRGKVVNGRGRGRCMGIPTANIESENRYVIPKIGVYETRTNIDNKLYLSLTNVGRKPTFNETDISIETYILGFDGSLYGKDIDVSFLSFIRNEKKFNTKEELIEQIKQDINVVKNRL